MSSAAELPAPHALTESAIARSRSTGSALPAYLYPGTPEMAQALRNELWGRCGTAKHAGPEDGVTDESLYVGAEKAWQVVVIG
jgi:hypothetical protein